MVNGTTSKGGAPFESYAPARTGLAEGATSATGNHSNPVADVYRGICEVAKQMSREGVGKGGKNQQQGYKFRGIDDICNALSPMMAAAELCILPRMLSRTQEERATAKGGVLFYVTVQADFDFVSSRDGSRHTVTMYGEAMDSADKATNKAMSAAYKYCVSQVFCIPTEGSRDDADATTPEPAAKAPKHTPRQQAIVAAKLATMPQPDAALAAAVYNRITGTRPQPAVAIAEQIPPEAYEDATYEEVELPEDERSQLEQELAESIALTERRKEMLQAFGVMKNRYAAIQAEKTYYAILKLHGVSQSAEFPTTQEGYDQAVICFAEMRKDITVRETRGR